MQNAAAQMNKKLARKSTNDILHAGVVTRGDLKRCSWGVQSPPYKHSRGNRALNFIVRNNDQVKVAKKTKTKGNLQN